MRRVVFLLGVYDRDFRRTGEVISDANFDLIDSVCQRLDVTADIVFAVPDPVWAGRAKDVTMDLLRKYRDETMRDIIELKPDVLVACGPIALKCLMNKGNVVLNDSMRQDISVTELNGTIVVATYSMEQIAAKPGMDRWLMLDVHAALHGRIRTKWGKYHILQPDTPEWHVMPKALAKAQMIGLDLETYPGLDPWAPDARIRMAVVSDKVGHAWVVQATPASMLPAWLDELMANPDVVCGGSNIKFDYRWLSRFGYTLTNMHDTSTAEHVLDCTNPMTDLKSLTFMYVPKLGDYSRGHRALVKERGGWEAVEDHEMYAYCGGDGEASIGAMRGQIKKLKDEGLERPFNLSMQLYTVLASMEERGACVSMDVNRELDSQFNVGMGELRNQIYETVGAINLNSPAQLVDALYENVKGINLTKARAMRQFSGVNYRLYGDEDDDDYSTDKEILEREAHKHPVIESILQYRRWAKLHGTYVDGLYNKHIVPHHGQHFVHTSYRTDVVETYRLSSQGPNLQNIPRKPEPDDPHPIPTHLNIKNQFVSRFGGTIIEADLSQAEIRIAAELSKDELMLAAITSGEDLHTALTAQFLGVSPDKVTKLQRTHGKRQTFLVLYGGGANTLSKQIGVSKAEAKEMLAQYFRTYGRLAKYIDKVKLDVKRNLYSESLFGYRRKFRKPPSWDCWDGWRIERQAWNHQVQNGAACITFVAMMDLEQAMRSRNLQSVIVMQVHDSIVIDCYPGEEEQVAALAKHCLEYPQLDRYGVSLTVPLVADVEIGTSWGQKQAME